MHQRPSSLQKGRLILEQVHAPAGSQTLLSPRNRSATPQKNNDLDAR